MTMTRIILAFLACAACFSAAFIVKKYVVSFVMFGTGLVWIFGGNLALWLLPHLSADHFYRWSPFYFCMIAGGVSAVFEVKTRKRKKT